MPLLNLDIYAVRNIQKATLTPSPRINFIFGENASGKSALIEAIFILGRARSFRTTTAKSVINFGTDHLIVSGQISQPGGMSQHLGVRMDARSFVCRLNQQTLPNRSSLAYALPLQLIYPKSFDLLDAGPQYRREFLDWGAFNHEPSFFPAWQYYKKALQQRNSLLRSKQIHHIHVWDQELVNYGTIVHSCRKKYIEKLAPVVTAIFRNFHDVESIDVNLFSGWDDKIEFLRQLQHELDKDSRYGFTHSGPHRADLHITIQGRMAKDILSRGQLKLLIISLKLAQVSLLAEETGHRGCVLLDDFAAELDVKNRAKLLKYLFDMKCQVFITATHVGEFGEIAHIQHHKMFHVEHGNIYPV